MYQMGNYDDYYMDQIEMYHDPHSQLLLQTGGVHHIPMVPMPHPHLMEQMGEMMPHNLHHLSNVSMDQDDSLDQSQELPPSICWTGLDMANIGLRSVHENIGNFRHLTSLYLSNNNLTSLSLSICNNLVNLTHLDISCNRIGAIPPQIEELQHLDTFLLKFNLVKELPTEMGRLWRLRELGLTGNPIVSPPSQIIAGGTSQIISYLKDKVRPITAPPDRSWVTYTEGDFSRTAISPTVPPSDPFKLRVFSYNILAETYQDQHYYTPSWALSWEYRKKKILKELIKYDCDVLCLQEVEGKQYHDYFNIKMNEKGYNGCFQPKSRARTMDDWSNVDGCAIFFKTSKFRLIHERLIEYQSLSLHHLSGVADKRVYERVHGRDNIALLLILQLNNSSNNNSNNNAKRAQNKQSNNIPNRVCVVNTHIHWDPSMPDVKLMQTQMLLDEIQNILKEVKEPDMPVIIGGDFNSTPNSGVYDLLRNGILPTDHVDCKGHRYGKYSTEGYNHKLQLNSAYSHLGEPPFTNFNYDFMGVLDYIWFSEKSLRLSGILQPVSEEDILQQKSPIPNPNFPSDHICIAAELEFTPPNIHHHMHHNNNRQSHNNNR